MKTWLSRLFSVLVQSESAAPPDNPDKSIAPNSNAAKHKDAGDQFLRDGDLTSAIAAYRQAIVDGATSAGLFCNLAFSLKETGHVEEAEKVLTDAVAQYPNSADCHHMLGEVARQSDKIDIAISEFRAALTVAPDFEDAYRELCVTLFGCGKFGDALEVAQTGLQRLPQSVDLHFWKGNLYHQLQRHEEAIAAFDAALALAPDRGDIAQNLSLNLLYMKQTQRAISILRQIAASPHASIATFNNLANALLEVGDFTEAIRHLQHALSINADDVGSLINIARALQQAGKPEVAIPYLQHALEINPHDYTASFDLASIHAASGAHEIACACYREALAINPDAAAPMLGEGLALCALRDFEQALSCFQSALIRAPDMLLAYANAGNALRELHRASDAIPYYRRALRIDPDLLDANLHLGAILHAQLDFEGAMACYRQALAIDPNSHLAHLNLGLLLCAMKRDEAAIASFQEASRLAPNDASTLNTLAQTLKNCGRKEDATVAWKKALVAEPAFESAWRSLAGLWQDVHSYDDACIAYRNALALAPENTDTLLGLGNALTHRQLYAEAIDCFRLAISLKPAFVGAYGNLANVLSDVGQHQEAIDTYQQALQNGPIDFRIYSNLLFARNYMPDVDRSTLVAEAVRYGELVAQQAKPYDTWPNERNAKRRLRVGLVSGDLRHHPVGFFIDSTLAALAADPARDIELIAYSNFEHSDYLTERIKSHCYAWRQIDTLGDETVARQVRGDDIDILLDLSGHSSMNRLPLFAWKPAPVQASWLGYFATTGVAGIDYFIADQWSVPTGGESQFTEQIWRLPETRFSFTAPTSQVDVAPLPALQNGYITFACFNNLSKMTDQVVALWARILGELPDSRLFLKSLQLGGEAIQKEVAARFAAHGISEHRLQLEGFTSRADYLTAYHRVDIALDPFPYTGGATTAESLWMGVPVFTLRGDRLIARQGTGLLMNAGLSDWIAGSEEDYLHGVLGHARNLERLAALRAGLRAQVLASPLFDATRLATHLQTALRAMWVTWCNQAPTRQ
jgi:predicted O-linked N-acetylglucosamine transferase (SPINDLY family)